MDVVLNLDIVRDNFTQEFVMKKKYWLCCVVFENSLRLSTAMTLRYLAIEKSWSWGFVQVGQTILCATLVFADYAVSICSHVRPI